jgi:hypothetical protein
MSFESKLEETVEAALIDAQLVESPNSLDQSVYMTTFTGRMFTLFDPKQEDISIVDISHALSMLCRFTGHCQHFYSVAQHCVHASLLVPEEFAMEALLHDASEAYINDLNRPMKHHPQMRGYRDAERVIEAAIRQKFLLPAEESREVKDVDNRLVCTEARQLLVPAPSWVERQEAFDLVLPVWDPKEAEHQFLQRYLDLP